MNKEALVKAKQELYDAVAKAIKDHEEEETRLSSNPHLPELRGVVAGGQAPAAPGEGQAAAVNPRVRLNVGASEIEVERAWLTAIKGSRLGRVFEQGWDSLLPRDGKNQIFLDLDVEQFRPIMVFLRQYAAQENLPEHPESKLTKEEAKWGFSLLLEQFGLGCLGTAAEARALGTKRAFLEKKEKLEAEVLQQQIKEPAAEKVIEVIKAQLGLFQQHQPLQAATAEKTLAVFEALVQWDKDLSQKRAESAVMESKKEEEKKFLQHLAGCGAQEEGRIEPARVVTVHLSDLTSVQTFRSTLSLCPKLAEKLPPVRNEEREDRLELDCDSSVFVWVLQHLRMKSLGLEVPRPDVPADKRAALTALLQELDLAREVPLGPQAPVVPAPAPGPVPLAPGSSLVTPAQLQALMEQLQTVGVRQLRLLYKGTKDQFTAQRFHQLCDNQGQTVTLCRSQQGHLFGGYSDVPWDSTSNFKRSNAAFLFKSGHREQLAFSRHNVFQNHQYAVRCYAGYGPFFGGGADMYVELNGTGIVHLNSFGYAYDKGPGNVSHLAEGTHCPLEEVEVLAAS